METNEIAEKLANTQSAIFDLLLDSEMDKYSKDNLIARLDYTAEELYKELCNKLKHPAHA